MEKENFENEILRKIDNHIALTENEVKELVCEYSVESNYCCSVSEYQISKEDIVKINDRYFKINWIEAQDGYNSFERNEYPKEVKKKTVMMEVWEEI